MGRVPVTQQWTVEDFMRNVLKSHGVQYKHVKGFDLDDFINLIDLYAEGDFNISIGNMKIKRQTWQHFQKKCIKNAADPGKEACEEHHTKLWRRRG
jgi:hypothetical protein